MTDSAIGDAASHGKERDAAGERAGRSPWAFCLALAIGTRLAVLLAGYLAVSTIGYGLSPLPRPVSRNALLNLPARWDAGWYVGIASGGYRWRPERPRYERLKFFPAYPLVLRAIAWPFSPTRHPLAWFWLGVAASTLLFALALRLIVVLGTALEGPDVARRAAWITAAYPFGIYFGVPYSESLFLVSTVAAVSSWRSGAWRVSAAWGLLAGLTRPNGFLIGPVLALSPRGVPREEGNGRVWRLLAIAAPFIGLASFGAYLYLTTGDALAWTTGQPAARESLNPASYVSHLAVTCWQDGFRRCIETRGYDLINVAATLVPFALLAPIVRRFGYGLGLFVLFNTLMPLVGVGFVCMGRYTSVLFPMFLLLAVGLTGWRFRLWLAVSFLSQWLLAAAFFTWRPVY